MRRVMLASVLVGGAVCVSPALASIQEAPDGTATPVTTAAGWSLVAPLGTPRAGLAAATGLDGRIYAIGGWEHSISAGCLATVEVYTPATNTWRPVASMSRPHCNTTAATGRDGRIYAIDGASVEAYDPGANTWTVVGPGPPRRPGGFATAAAPDGRIYTMGGYDPRSSDFPYPTVEAYTPSTRRWREVAPMPTARADHAAATGRDGRIYAIGGNDGFTSYARVEAYTPRRNTWREVAAVPVGNIDLLAAVGAGDGRIYAVGGIVAGVRVADVRAYTPASDRWSRAPSLNRPRSRFAAAASGGRIYAIGGESATGTRSSVESLATP